jgi:hypothetical protein
MSIPLPEEKPERGLGLGEAVPLNRNATVGIGLLGVIPLVIQAQGVVCWRGWLARALFLSDGVVWAKFRARNIYRLCVCA